MSRVANVNRQQPLIADGRHGADEKRNFRIISFVRAPYSILTLVSRGVRILNKKKQI